MEKGCSAASSNCESAEDAQQELSERKPEKEKEQKKKTTPQGPQSKPSTSQVRVEAGAEEEPEELEEESMSKLRGEDVADVDCVSHSSHSHEHEHEHGHGFAVVLDDESSTETGVLETFEISSSNSLPPAIAREQGVLRPQSVLLLLCPLTIAPPQILSPMGLAMRMRMSIRRITASAPVR